MNQRKKWLFECVDDWRNDDEDEDVDRYEDLKDEREKNV